MIKTFITGIVLGVAGVMAALYMIPVVDQHREVSIIAVAPNGRTTETFQVNIPMDRILVGDNSSKSSLPAGLEWPNAEILDGSRIEIYKLRNSRNAVIGIASRVAASNSAIGNVIEWVLHLPARGSMYVTLDPASGNGGRDGQLRAGTREFAALAGSFSERWVANTEDSSEDDSTAVAGRIELLARYVADESKAAVSDIE